LTYADEDGARGSDQPWQPQSWKGSKFDGQRDLLLHPNVSRKPRGGSVHGNKPGRSDGGAACNKPGQEMRNRRDVWTVDDVAHGKHSTQSPNSSGKRITDNIQRARNAGHAHDLPFGDTRNKRDVWTVNTEAFSGAHFAVFPPALILPCLLAGCPPGGVCLDPFSGAGTTALVAKENGRRCIGIDLNRDYLDMSVRRLRQEVFAF
jgi:hypothetical protein